MERVIWIILAFVAGAFLPMQAGMNNKLAKTSSTPGKTKIINHFLINDNWYLVDLPGYGYARRGQKGQEQIKTIIEDYILEREQMTNLFVLIDSRLEPQKIDLEFMEWLGENGKISPAQRDQDRFGVGPVMLDRLTLAVRAHELGRHQARRQAQMLRGAAPVMGAAAGFHADHCARRQ